MALTLEGPDTNEGAVRDPSGMRWTRHQSPRPYIYVPDLGKEIIYTRVTTFIACLESRNALEAWGRRVVLIGLHEDPELVEQLRMTSPDDREGLTQIAERAFEAGDGYVSANKGTDLHKLADLAVRTGQLPADPTDRADIVAYLNALDRFGIEPLDTEQRVVIDELKVTGSYDLRVRHAGKIKVLDLKTGKQVDKFGPGEKSMQLAMYARGQHYDPLTTVRTQQEVDLEEGIIAHVRAGSGTCELFSADLEMGWMGVLLADRVRRWRKISEDVLQPLDFA